MSQNVITETNLTNLDLANKGKVRDLYDLGEAIINHLNGSDLGV